MAGPEDVSTGTAFLTIGYCYPPDVHGPSATNAPGQPLLGDEKFSSCWPCPTATPSGRLRPSPCPPWTSSSPCPTRILLVARTKGRVTAYAAGVNEGHGHGQFPEKYAKFAYDTRFRLLRFPQPRGDFTRRPPTVCWPLSSTTTSLSARYPSPTRSGADRGGQQVVPLPPAFTVTTTVLPTADGHNPPPRDRKRLPLRGLRTAALPCRTSPPAMWSPTAGGAATARNAAVSCTVSGSGEGTVIKCDPNVSPVQHQRLYPCRPVRHPRGAHRDRDRDQKPRREGNPRYSFRRNLYKSDFCTERPRKRALFFVAFFGPLRPCGPPPPQRVGGKRTCVSFGKVLW